MPTSFTNEKDNEFSIFWSSTILPKDKYGMYNLNNGFSSFEYPVPDDSFGPGRFSRIIPSKTGFRYAWGINGNEIWNETAIAVPKTFKEIPISSLLSGNLRQFFSDPDNETVLWCATENRLYKVGSVGSTPGSSPGISKRLILFNKSSKTI